MNKSGPRPMPGQKLQALPYPILLVGFKGDIRLNVPFFEKSKKVEEIYGTLAQGQMVIQTAVIVVEVEHA